MTTQPELHPTPRSRNVLGEQLRAVGISLRREWLLFAVGLGVVTLLLMLGEIREMTHPNVRGGFNLTSDVFGPLVLLGLLAPMSVWKGEGPSRRGYHWAMPVDRVRHTLARCLVGWGWLMLMVAVFLLWAAAMALVTGGNIGLEPAHGTLVPGEGFIGSAETRMFAWQWAVPFVSATITYLLGSVVVVASDHPWIWMAGIGFGFLVIAATLSAVGMEGGIHLAEQVAVGKYGIQTALTGERTVTEMVLFRGRRIPMSSDVPDLRGWVVGSLVWLTVSLAATLWAARRHPEASA